MDDRQLMQEIDACRPGSNDLSDPELAGLAERLAADRGARERYERVQRLDAVLSEALDDVPLPAGLADRLLASLAAVPVESPAAPLVTESLAEPAATVPNRSRRRMLWGASLALASAAAVAGLALWAESLRPTDLTAAMIVDQVVASHHRKEPVESTQGKPPASHPLSRAVVVRDIAWRWTNIPLGKSEHHAVAYELRGQGTEGILYVVQAPAPLLPKAPPSIPVSTTGNCSAAAWQEGNLVYVLVVHGDERAYRRFLKDAQLA